MISVLYVDDESALLEVTRIFMERGGDFTVDTASSAREGIEKLKSRRYDALVSDYQMPEMDGLELLKYLRPRCNGMPFILFTGKGGEEVAIDALNAGADYYIQKGGSPRAQFAELETKIRSAVARRQSEQALRHSEQEYRMLVENLTDVIYAVNAEGIVTYISPGINHFGYEPKEVVGKDFAHLVCAEDIPEAARFFAEVKSGISPVPLDFRLLDHSGQSHWVRISCRPRIDQGRLVSIQGIITEISEHKKEDENLKARERLHQVLLDTADEGMVIIDPESGMAADFNDDACRELGYLRDEFARVRLKDYECADAPQTLSRKTHDLYRLGQVTFETRFCRKDTTVRDVLVTARMSEEGKKKYIVMVFRDITDEKTAGRDLAGKAAWFETVYRQSPVAALTLSADGGITGINKAAEDLFGTTGETVQGKDLADYISAEERDRFHADIRKLSLSGHIHTGPFSLGGPREKPVFLMLEGTAVRDKDDKAARLIVTLPDVSGLMQEMDALRTSALSAKGILAGARDGIISCTSDLVLTEWNEAMEDISGISHKDALGKPLFELLPFLGTQSPESPPLRALSGEIAVLPDTRYEYPAPAKNGWCRIVFSPVRATEGTISGIVGIVQEITARTRAFQRVLAQNRLYAITGHVRAAAVQARRLEALLETTCQSAAETDGVAMSWVGLFDPASGILRPIAVAGAAGELPKEGVRITDQEGDTDPVSIAIHRGTPGVCEDTRDGAAQPWKEAALRQGYRSLAAVPFRLNGEVVGVLVLCSSDPGAFSRAENDLLGLLGTTLSWALDLLDKKTLQRRAGKGSHGSWERTRFLAEGLETSPVPFAALHADGTTGAVNAALCRLLKYTEEELLSLPLLDLFLNAETLNDSVQRILSTQAPERHAYSLKKKDGTAIPVEVFLGAMTDETTGERCVSFFILDNSLQTEQIAGLTRESSLYRTLFDSCSVPVLLTTARGDIRAANPAACELFGQQPAAICLVPGEGHAGGACDPRFVELIRTCGESGHASGVMRLVRGDGTQFDAAVTAACFGEPEGEAAFTLAMREIPVAEKKTGAPADPAAALSALFDTVPYPVRRTLPNQERVFFNKAWRACTGSTQKSEDGNGWMDGIHPDDRQRYEAGGSAASGDAEYRLKSQDGTYRWIHECRVPDPGEDEDSGGITFFCCDIDRQKRAEAALENLKKQSYAVFEQANLAIICIKNDRITEGNPAAGLLFAVARQDLCGRHLQDFFPPTQPDGRTSAAAIKDYFLAAGRGECPVFSWIFLRADGTTRETTLTLLSVPVEGEVQTWALIDDITARTRTERELRRLISYPQLNPNPVIDVLPDRTFTYANPATADVLAAVGLPPDPVAFLPADFDTLAGSLGTAQQRAANRIVHIKERSFNETISSAPGYATLRIYAYDITDRVQAAEALAYANHKLGILTSITRHDIKNRLTGVLGYLDLLRGSLRDPVLIEYLEKAEVSADAIRDHIDFTKEYESLGGTAPVWQEIAPIISEIRAHCEAGGISFEEPEPGFAVFADPMLEKVLYNLVDNSLRHGVHVRHIRVKSHPSKTVCVLTYEDDGVGIPQDKKERIFERGYTTSSGSSKTSGLGLFLVREILAITGITIKETGEPGTGTRFEIQIPAGKWRKTST